MKFIIDKTKPAKTLVKRSKAGLGLYAGEDLKKGAFVIEYVGDRINEAESDRRGGMYLFEVAKDLFIDGKGRKNVARYINHKCKPNCEVDIKKKRVFIFTTKNIKKGEELGYDYGVEFFDEFIRPQGCKCGAEKHLY